MPIENLQAFYKKYYQPDNVVLIVAGKFDEAKALALVEKHLGSIPKPTRKLDATYTEEPPQDGERTVTLRRVGAVGSAGVAYHMPAASHADWAPLSLLGGIISQSPNGRLYKALVESKLATNANARSENAHDPGLFFASASCPPETLDAVRDTLVKTLESLGDVPFTEDEVNKAKVRSKRSAELLPSNSQAMSQALSSAASHGDWRLLFIQRDRIAAVTAVRRQPRGENVFPEAQSHGRALHPSQGIDSSGRAERPAHRPRREGLQGRHRRGGGRSLRPLAGKP